MNVSPYWVIPILFGVSAYLISSPSSKGTVSPVQDKESPVVSIVARASEKLFTSKQDSNTMLALMHCTEAMALVDAARRVENDHAIARHTGVDIAEMYDNAERRRRHLVRRLSQIEDVDDS